MRHIRRTILVALVWLTAASTLLAGLPRSECVCPTTHQEPSSPDAKAKGTGCCCSCCAPESGERKGPHPCCRNQGQESRSDSPKPTEEDPGKEPFSKASDGSPRLTQPRCARTLAPSGGVTAAVAKIDSADLPAPGLFAPVVASPVAAPSPCAPPYRLLWLTSHAPPPTDLVVAFQHFVI